MNRVRLITIVFTILMVLSCSKNEEDKAEITHLIELTYSKNRSFSALDFTSARYSTSLLALVKEAKEVTKQSQIAIQNSEFPTDKPNIIEGNVLVSLYDGFTNYQLLSIEKSNDSTQKVSIKFEYDSKPKISWIDTIVVIKETHWKIDDVVYSSKNTNEKSFKLKLAHFIKARKE